jgi:HTH-type transcriptional regulator/antitoxin HigA
MAHHMTERIPAEVFPPGEFLADELEARGWTQVEFAEIIQRPTKLVNEIVAGKKSITPETARGFAAALGTSPQYWLNLETAYQLWRTAPSPNADIITRTAKLRERFPVHEIIKRGWIEPSDNPEVTERRVLDFYGITNNDEEPQIAHAARRNRQENLSPYQEAWLFRVRQLAMAIRAPKYSERRLRDTVVILETLLTEPEEIRHVPGLLAECGVRLIIVEPIPNSRIDGVCFWINDGKSPVLGLTLKWDFIDRFWFNLRHEIEHALRGDGKTQVVIDDFEGGFDTKDEAEIAANAAAAEFCVPQASLNDFILRHDPMFSTTNFIGFSRLMKRHPGIVAGQLQNKIGRPELFKKFQARVRDIIADTALTDGYGKELPFAI